MNKKDITCKDIRAYIQGKIRYALFYSKYKWLIRKHIREQIVIRINSMNPTCYEKGSCILCGCETTALQMANKTCDKPCYPKMLNRGDWLRMKEGLQIVHKGLNWMVKDNKFKTFRV